MSLLRIWFGGTVALIAGWMIWAFVPVLVPILGLTAAIGALVAVIIMGVRWLERARVKRR